VLLVQAPVVVKQMLWSKRLFICRGHASLETADQVVLSKPFCE